MSNEGYQKLWGWFGCSYASWLTIPRVLMHAMPDDWQERMAKLLEEYNEEFPSHKHPNVSTRVHLVGPDNKFTKVPHDLINYRHPNREWIESLRRDEE